MTTLTVFGAGGDLAARYLFPALADLLAAGRLPGDFRLRGADRRDWDDDSFRHHVRAAVAGHPPGGARDTAAELARRADYAVTDVTDAAAVAEALKNLDGPLVVYLALPARLFEPCVRALRGAGLPPDSRVVVEKPFGVSRESARTLNALLSDTVPETQVFRIDHFLAKQTVQNVLGLRLANRVFESVWNAQNVERVEIAWEETLALEGRAGYYDRSGALRDMLQNHLLQLLCLVAMEPPRTLGERDLRDRKVDVLRSIQPTDPEAAGRHSVRARYTAGTVDGQRVPDYTGEVGVDPANRTETFAEITVHVDNWRWAGVPFRLRSGKAFGRPRKEIAVHFRPVPHLAFDQPHQAVPNVLRLTLNPDTITLDVNLNGSGDPFDLDPAALRADLAPQELPAYARLLLDVLSGDPSLFIRGDEAEEAWRVVEPVLEAWARDRVPLLTYPAGSTGPAPAAG
ncbi:glucose-6-phosphate dehydrogenase [Allostreptomyces psammosilenae]|uniref:Glucose-6-phosphate 1-dehydrogenase n=1 Tax=Allostreptomyces psammosilenae TaxID=1892865 RepID=A0A852ZR43_9ACTN|nr:glucose-6-phosphate dehydrogenase [Allostreptomyces psammosilenae]NYI04849.1 glucose-6-phosphate 1-dehydrogenase [Allostreptomyces psammosilenae]